MLIVDVTFAEIVKRVEDAALLVGALREETPVATLVKSVANLLKSVANSVSRVLRRVAATG